MGRPRRPACLLADMMWYEAGKRWGDQILHFIYGLALDPNAASRRSKEAFVRHGARILMLAKFVVGRDAATPPLAGPIVGRSWSINFWIALACVRAKPRYSTKGGFGRKDEKGVATTAMSPVEGRSTKLTALSWTHEPPTRPISKARASGWETGSTFCSRGPDRQSAYIPSGGDS